MASRNLLQYIYRVACSCICLLALLVQSCFLDYYLVYYKNYTWSLWAIADVAVFGVFLTSLIISFRYVSCDTNVCCSVLLHLFDHPDREHGWPMRSKSSQLPDHCGIYIYVVLYKRSERSTIISRQCRKYTVRPLQRMRGQMSTHVNMHQSPFRKLRMGYWVLNSSATWPSPENFFQVSYTSRLLDEF